MSANQLTRRLCLLGIVVGLSVPANAQYQQGADGRLLDANNQVGSGGFNQRGYQQPINATNLIMTGNVTGGRAFQGFSPIRNSNQFFINLPSSGLDNFRRDSVSVNGSVGGVNMLTLPRPYFSPSQTITNAGAIANGMNVPGGSIPRNIYEVPYASPLLPTGQFVSPLQTPTESLSAGTYRVDEGANPYAQNAFAPTQFQSPVFGSPSVERPYNPWVAQSTLFSSNAALRRQQDAMLAPPGMEAEPGSEETEIGFQDLREDLRIDTRIDRRVSTDGVEFVDDPEFSGEGRPGFSSGTELRDYAGYGLPGTAAMVTSPAERMQPRFAVPSLTSQDGMPMEAGSDPSGELAPALSPADPGYDALEDARRRGESYLEGYLERRRSELLEAVDAQWNAKRPPFGIGDRGPSADTPADATDGIPLNRTLPGEYALPSPGERSSNRQRTTQLSALFDDKVDTFVGPADSPINRRLATAEKLMHSRQYFRAAGQYKIAEVMDPAHPLPVFGRAHALIAAGEYYTAVRLVLRGIDMFPGFASVRIDLNQFIRDAELLDRRRADLERRLADLENPEFRFLLGYIEFYMGLTEYGVQNFMLASAQAPDDSTIARFPHVLRQRMLAEQQAAEPDETTAGEDE